MSLTDDPGVDDTTNRIPQVSDDVVDKLYDLFLKRMNDNKQQVPEKKNVSRITEKQYLALVEFMESHSNIKRLPGIQGRAEYDNMWLKLADRLNSIEGGCNKTAEEWRKTWGAKKRLAKKKYEENSLNITFLEEKILRISQINDFGIDDDGPNLSTMPSEEIVIEPQLHGFDMTSEGVATVVSTPPSEPPVPPHQHSFPQQQPSVPLQQRSVPPQKPSFSPQQPSFLPQQQPSFLPQQQPASSLQPPTVPPQQPSFPPQQPSFPPPQPSFLPPQQQTSISDKQPSNPEQQISIQKPPAQEQQLSFSVSYGPFLPSSPESKAPSPSPPLQMPTTSICDPQPIKAAAEATGTNSIPRSSTIKSPRPLQLQRKRAKPRVRTRADFYSYKVKQARLRLEETQEINRSKCEMLRIKLESDRIDADKQLTQALNRLADNTQKLIEKFG